MKLNLGKRLLLFVYWLASLIVLAMLAIPQYTNIALSYITALIPTAYMQYAVIALLTVYLLLSLGVLCLIFKRSSAAKRSERGFITVDSADSGRVKIAITAIEQMVKQAAHTVDGLADMKIGITNADDAIEIQVNVTMVSGSHVPTVTLNLQRAIRQYVEMNCGVAVRSVSVSIQSVVNPADGSKRMKRRDVKAAPEWTPEPMTVPVSAVAEEPSVAAVPVEAPAYEPAVNSDEVAESLSAEESAEEPVEAAIDEPSTEYEK